MFAVLTGAKKNDLVLFLCWNKPMVNEKATQNEKETS